MPTFHTHKHVCSWPDARESSRTLLRAEFLAITHSPKQETESAILPIHCHLSQNSEHCSQLITSVRSPQQANRFIASSPTICSAAVPSCIQEPDPFTVHACTRAKPLRHGIKVLCTDSALGTQRYLLQDPAASAQCLHLVRQRTRCDAGRIPAWQVAPSRPQSSLLVALPIRLSFKHGGVCLTPTEF